MLTLRCNLAKKGVSCYNYFSTQRRCKATNESKYITKLLTTRNLIEADLGRNEGIHSNFLDEKLYIYYIELSQYKIRLES